MWESEIPGSYVNHFSFIKIVFFFSVCTKKTLNYVAPNFLYQFAGLRFHTSRVWRLYFKSRWRVERSFTKQSQTQKIKQPGYIKEIWKAEVFLPSQISV